MSEQRQNFELLNEFTRRGDQAAFASLVRRHIDLVYATALRKVEDAGGAEEIAQDVFVLLARKAWQFAPDDSLPAWLYRVTVLKSKAWLRTKIRRRGREQAAAEMHTTMKVCGDEPILKALLPLLDEGLLSLREKDRTALLLRYYESQSLREVGSSLGIREDAAQKRVAAGLEKLARFFQRRGFKTATSAGVAIALEKTASSAPAALSISLARTAAQMCPAATSLTAFLSRIAGLTKVQTASLCVILAAAPVGWQWSKYAEARKMATTLQDRMDGVEARQRAVAEEISRLEAESGKLDGTLAESMQAAAENRAALGVWRSLGDRVRGLLTAADYRWPGDLPYARIPKALISQLDLQSTFNHRGQISPTALELLGMTPAERQATEEALANYWQGVDQLMAAGAYETNRPAADSDRLTKTVVVPPLGDDLKGLAEATAMQLTDQLGPDRERILFSGWDEGAIQLFWPGNMWKISEQPQEMAVWVERSKIEDGKPRYGASWRSSQGGTFTEGSLGSLPPPFAARFFAPWLRGFGIPDSTSSAP